MTSTLTKQISTKEPITGVEESLYSIIKPGTSPIQIDTASIKPGTSPIQIDTASIKPGTSPIQIDTASIKTGTSPIQIDTASIKTDTSLIQTDTASIKPDTSLIQTDTASIKPDTSAVKPEVSQTLAKTKVELERAIFPFSAIVGQEQMKLALILNVIDPRIGGVMIMGDRGTGKTTAVRAIADLLPEIQVVSADPYNSEPNDYELMSEAVKAAKKMNIPFPTEFIKVPMIDLPLGATEDRVCGTIDIEKALSYGTKAFEPGLLARANRGILYVDEVNLLDDHLVDILLDSAASGWNTVEREGISIKHPARFVLVGSGNPEEGELRPQLLDRFGLHAEIRTVTDPKLRMQVVEQRNNFDQDSLSCLQNTNNTQQVLKNRIQTAQTIISFVGLDYKTRLKVSQVCGELRVDGLRGDIVTNRAAKAYAAFNGRVKVTDNDIEAVIILALRHRLRKGPLEAMNSGEKILRAFNKVFK